MSTSWVVRIAGWAGGTSSQRLDLDDVRVYGSATGFLPPAFPATNLVVEVVGGNVLGVSWEPGSGEKRLVVVAQGGVLGAMPVNGVEYLGVARFGEGDMMAPGQVVVYSGDEENEVWVTGLQPGQTYTVGVFEFNGGSTASAYLLEGFPALTVSTLEDVGSNRGGIKVTVLPPSAVGDGAGWRLDGGPPKSVGEDVPVLAGWYTLSYDQAAGWREPREEYIRVEAGVTQELTAVYLEVPPVVRVASFNAYVGIGEVGGMKYEAAKAVLSRIDADIVAFQELRAVSSNEFVSLVTELGHPYWVWGVNSGTLGGNHFLAFSSRHPIVDWHDITSPPGANDMTRPPLRATFEVAAHSDLLTLWNVHHKASADWVSAFRRAVESIRLVADIDGYLSVHTGRVNYAVLGDFNGDYRAWQPDFFLEPPDSSWLPAVYQLGEDILEDHFPMPYRLYPDDRYRDAGMGLTRVPAFQGNGTSLPTHWGGSILDYILISPALGDRMGARTVAEVYNSVWDTEFDGLWKRGDPLPPETSGQASDHFALFMDLWLVDPEGYDPLPRWWRYVHFGQDGPTTLGVSRAWDDPDGDGRTNWEEYLADTDPNDPASVFDGFVAVSEGRSVRVAVGPGSQDRVYSVQVRETLADNGPRWRNLHRQAGHEDGFERVIELDDEKGMKVYRVQVSLP